MTDGLIPVTPELIAHIKGVFSAHNDADEAAWAEHGDAATEAFAATGATLDALGGNCPVQAEGDVDGKRFYFRARGGAWQFHVADEADGIFGPNEWVIERDYGDGPYDAGWMPRHEALGFITQGIAEYRTAHPGLGDGA